MQRRLSPKRKEAEMSGNKYGLFFGVLVLVSASNVASVNAETSGQQGVGEVARAQFTTAIEEREPVDNVVLLSSEVDQVYFFTDLRQLEGQTVTHRWEYNGKVEAEVNFQVTSDRWRAFSSKNLDPGKLGPWTVVVVDERGWPIKAALFEYVDGPTKLFGE